MASRARSKPLTDERIVEAALELTAARGLDGWSLRDLAAALDTWHNNITHHIGDRAALSRLVVDRVIALLPYPDAGLPWRDWFGQFLRASRPHVRRYPGVARHIVRYGPTVPAALPIIDRGIQVLTAAGFGDNATLVYRYLLASAFSLIAAEDDRAAHPAGEVTMAELLARNRDGHPGLAAAAADARDRDERRAGPGAPDDAFYEFTVERALDGVAVFLAARK